MNKKVLILSFLFTLIVVTLGISFQNQGCLIKTKDDLSCQTCQNSYKLKNGLCYKLNPYHVIQSDHAYTRIYKGEQITAASHKDQVLRRVLRAVKQHPEFLPSITMVKQQSKVITRTDYRVLCENDQHKLEFYVYYIYHANLIQVVDVNETITNSPSLHQNVESLGGASKLQSQPVNGRLLAIFNILDYLRQKEYEKKAAELAKQAELEKQKALQKKKAQQLLKKKELEQKEEEQKKARQQAKKSQLAKKKAEEQKKAEDRKKEQQLNKQKQLAIQQQFRRQKQMQKKNQYDKIRNNYVNKFHQSNTNNREKESQSEESNISSFLRSGNVKLISKISQIKAKYEALKEKKQKKSPSISVQQCKRIIRNQHFWSLKWKIHRWDRNNSKIYNFIKQYKAKLAQCLKNKNVTQQNIDLNDDSDTATSEQIPPLQNKEEQQNWDQIVVDPPTFQDNSPVAEQQQQTEDGVSEQEQQSQIVPQNNDNQTNLSNQNTTTEVDVEIAEPTEDAQIENQHTGSQQVIDEEIYITQDSLPAQYFTQDVRTVVQMFSVEAGEDLFDNVIFIQYHSNEVTDEYALSTRYRATDTVRFYAIKIRNSSQFIYMGKHSLPHDFDPALEINKFTIPIVYESYSNQQSELFSQLAGIITANNGSHFAATSLSIGKRDYPLGVFYVANIHIDNDVDVRTHILKLNEGDYISLSYEQINIRQEPQQVIQQPSPIIQEAPQVSSPPPPPPCCSTLQQKQQACVIYVKEAYKDVPYLKEAQLVSSMEQILPSGVSFDFYLQYSNDLVYMGYQATVARYNDGTFAILMFNYE